MYHKFFGLTDAPFRITPDPRFLYLGPAHREALATLIYGIRERKGLVALTGGVGTGKTTLLEGLFERLASECVFVRVRDPRADFTAILRELLGALGLPSQGVDRTEAMRLLWERLSAADAVDINPTLVIDEAQDVRDEVLEDFRLLSNLETHDRKLIQMLLVAQPEFRRRLEAPGLEPLRQRIALSTTLHPLTLSECTAYVKHRLSVAGAEPDGIFAIGAFEAIHDYARGIPRLINVVCDGALSMGYATGTRPIHAALVREVVHDLRGEGAPLGGEVEPARTPRSSSPAQSRTRRASGGRWVAAAGIGSALALVAALAGPRLSGRAHHSAAIPKAPVAATPRPTADTVAPALARPDAARTNPEAGEQRSLATTAATAPIEPPPPSSAVVGDERSAHRNLAAIAPPPLPVPEPSESTAPSVPEQHPSDVPQIPPPVREPVLDGVPEVRENARNERLTAHLPADANTAEGVLDDDAEREQAAREQERLRLAKEQARLAKEEARERERDKAKEKAQAKEKERAAAKALADRKAAARERDEASSAPDRTAASALPERGGAPDATLDEATAERESASAGSRVALLRPDGESPTATTRPVAKMLIVPDAPETSQPVAASVRMKELYAARKLGAAEVSPHFVPGDTVNLVAVYELANVSPDAGPVAIDLWVRGPNQENVPTLGARRELAARAGTFQAAVARRIPVNAPSGVYGLVARVSHGGTESRRVFLFRVD